MAAGDDDYKGGIGAGLSGRAGKYYLAAVVTGGPCDEEGLQDGDRILEVGGWPTDRMHLDEVVRLVRGSIGSQVSLKLLTCFGFEQEVTLQRVEITTGAARSLVVDEFGVLNSIAEYLDGNYEPEMKRAEEADQAGDFIAAKALWDLCLVHNFPKNAFDDYNESNMLWGAGSFFLSIGRFDESSLVFRKLISNSAEASSLDDWGCFFAFAKCLEQRGSLDDAEEVFRNLLASLPTAHKHLRLDLYKAYAWFLFRQSRRERLRRFLLEKIGELEEANDTDGCEFVGDMFFAIEHFGDAAECWMKASTIFERVNAEYQRKYVRDAPLIRTIAKTAGAYYERHDFIKAEEFARDALDRAESAIPLDLEAVVEKKASMHPSKSSLRLQLGDILNALGKRKEANESYEDALKLRTVAFGRNHPLVQEVRDRLSASPSTEVAVLIRTRFEERLYRSERRVEDPVSLDAYRAIQSGHPDAYKLAMDALKNVAAETFRRLSPHHIAQFFHLIELLERTSAQKALQLLMALEKVVPDSKTLLKLCVCEYGEWIRGRSAGLDQIPFTSTSKLLGELVPLRQEHGPAFKETFRWRANEWRRAQYPAIALAMLEKASRVPISDDSSDQGLVLRSKSLIEVDKTLALVALGRFDQAEELFKDRVSGENCILSDDEGNKWYQVCDALAASGEGLRSERLLEWMFNALLKRDARSSDTDYQKAQLLLRLAQRYLGNGSLDKAEKTARKAIAVWTEASPRESSGSFAVLGEVLEKQGQTESAIEAYLNASEALRRERFDPRLESELNLRLHALQLQERFVADASAMKPNLVRIAELYQNLNRKNDAEALTLRLSSINENASVQDPESAIKSLKLIATQDMDRGREREAIEALSKAAQIEKENFQNWGDEYRQLVIMQIRRKLFTDAAANALVYFGSPAFTSANRDEDVSQSLPFVEELCKGGAYQEALFLVETLKEEKVLRLGNTHFSVFGIQGLLVWLYSRAEQFDRAESITETVLAFLERSSYKWASRQGARASHPVVDDLHRAARVLREKNQWTQCGYLLNRILRLQTQFLGAGNLEIGYTEQSIAQLHSARGEYSDAQPHLKRAVDIVENNFNPYRHNVHRIKEQYIDVLRKLDAVEEIESVRATIQHNQFYDMNRHSLVSWPGNFHGSGMGPDVVRTKLLEGARQIESVSGSSSFDFRQALTTLATFETAYDNIELSLDLRKKILEITNFVEAPDSATALEQFGLIVGLYLSLGNRPSAELAVRERIDLLMRTTPEFQSDAHLIALAESQVFVGETASALDSIQFLVDRLLRLASASPEKSRGWASTLRKCAQLLAELGKVDQSRELHRIAQKWSGAES